VLAGALGMPAPMLCPVALKAALALRIFLLTGIAFRSRGRAVVTAIS
jgi:hypothetical protein